MCLVRGRGDRQASAGWDYVPEPRWRVAGAGGFHGPIVEVSRCATIVERADTGKPVSLPPGWEPGVRGKYRLRSTGEVVVDPDFVAEWTFVEEGDRH